MKEFRIRVANPSGPGWLDLAIDEDRLARLREHAAPQRQTNRCCVVYVKYTRSSELRVYVSPAVVARCVEVLARWTTPSYTNRNNRELPEVDPVVDAFDAAMAQALAEQRDAKAIVRVDDSELPFGRTKSGRVRVQPLAAHRALYGDKVGGYITHAKEMAALEA